MNKTPGKNTPRNSKRGCLCKNGTYHVDCCDGSLQAQGIGTINITIMAKNQTGLEAIDEGNGIGYRLIGRNPDNFGNIGVNAIDFGIQVVPTNGINDFYAEEPKKQGASGLFSFVNGIKNEATNNYAIAIGALNVASGSSSYARGEGHLASAVHSEATGAFNVSSANHAITRGAFNFARSSFENSFGIYGTDYTPANDDTDRLLNYGYGNDENNRKDIYTLFKNGAVRFFRATLASIQNTVKEGFLIFNSDDNNRPYIHDGTEWHGLAYKNVGYTVANLPAGETGQTAYVTDAANISYRGVVSGSGTETALVFYDGTNWIYH